MKLFRTIGIILALAIPAVALATPKVASCCDGSCCPGCPFCHHGG